MARKAKEGDKLTIYSIQTSPKKTLITHPQVIAADNKFVKLQFETATGPDTTVLPFNHFPKARRAVAGQLDVIIIKQ